MPDPTDLCARGGPRVFGTLPFPDLLFNEKLEVTLQLCVEVAVQLSLSEQRAISVPDPR
jgi:hypothetical protein